MSSIGAVIERARAGGQYSERKRFTIARGRAIEKMRRFALAEGSLREGLVSCSSVSGKE